MVEKSQYKTLDEWRKTNPRVYGIAKMRGFLGDICETFGWELYEKRLPISRWTKEDCIEDTKKYKTRSEWYVKNSSTYRAAKNFGWFDECVKHMKEYTQKPHGYWNNKERCLAEAKKYKTRTKWQDNSHGSFRAAKKFGWFDECIKHMR